MSGAENAGALVGKCSCAFLRGGLYVKLILLYDMTIALSCPERSLIELLFYILQMRVPGFFWQTTSAVACFKPN